MCGVEFYFDDDEDDCRSADLIEMVRLAAPGGRIVLCDGLASADRFESRCRAFPETGRSRRVTALFEGDPLGMGAVRTPDGVKVVFPSAVLSAVKPG